MAGVVAAAAALGVSELLAGLLPGATSLVAAVGQVVIDLQPPGAKDVVVALFGTNDKLALELFIVAVARRSSGPGSGSWRAVATTIAAVGFVAFGVVGFLAALGDPLANPAIVAVAAAVSVGVGLWVLGWLLDRSRDAAVDRGDRRGPRADARLVAPLVPHPGRRRRRRARSPPASSAGTCSSGSGPRRSATGRPCRRRR